MPQIKKLVSILTIALFVFSSIPAAGITEPDYVMRIDLFPSEHELKGSLVAKVSSEEIKGRIHPDLVIDHVRNENNKELRYERLNKDFILYPEDSREIRISFHGKPYDEIWKRDVVGEYTNIITGDILVLWTEPKNPVFQISVPKSFTVLKVRERTVEKKYIGGEDPSVEMHEDRAVYTFRTTSNNMWFISAEYVSSNETKDGIEYNVYLFPEHKDKLNETMRLAQELIEFYSERYYPYPLKEFRVVECPTNSYETNWANDRYSTTFISFDFSKLLVNAYGDKLGESVKEYFDTIFTITHETSHFWFGGLVASEKLNEAFARFSEILFTESFDPDLSREYRRFLTERLIVSTNNWRNVSLADVDWIPKEGILGNSNIGYDKGGMIIYMLYQILGEELFDVFHEYFERYGGEPGAYNEASLEDFINLVNEKRDMKWFFDEWVYKPGLPDYELSNLSIVRRLRGYRLEFDVVQKGDIYRMPVEISAGSNTQTFMVDQRIERVTMDVDKLPERITLDPDYRIPKQKEAYLTVEPSIFDRCWNVCH